MRARLAILASHPRLPWLLAGLATLLAAPSLGAGFLLDDYWHQNALTSGASFDAPGSPYDLFVFVRGDPGSVRAMVDAGTLPWWTPDTLRIQFWRPLSELTHALDHWLAPREPVVAHLHNLLWGALLVGLATRLFRQIQGVGLASGLAALIFAVDDAHAFPLVWIAGRNAVIAATLGIAALLCHVRWQRHGWRTGAVLGPVCFAAALLGAEAAIAVPAYLFAYHVVFPPEHSQPGLRGAAARARPLLAYAVIAVAYLLAYRALGYGVAGSGQYLDPFGQPLQYLIEAPPRALLLLAGQLATLPLALESFHYQDEGGRRALIGLSAVLVFAAAAVIAPRWRHPGLRFWLIGMVLSLAPALVLGAFSRVLIFAGIGGAGVFGIVFEDWYRGVSSRPGAVARVVRYGFVVMQVVLAPLALIALSAGLPRVMDHHQERLDELLGAERQTWVFVNARAVFWAGGNVQASRRYAGDAVPTVRALASGALGLSVHRSAERCLDVEPTGGYLYLTADRLFRDPRLGLPVGWRRELPGLTVEILDVLPDGRPKTARFCFERALADPSLHWVQIVAGRPEVFHLPELGSTVALAP